MSTITIKEYCENIKKERENWFLNPYDLVYQKFEEEEFHLKDTEFFMQNVSIIIETLIEKCWEYFYPLEKKFTSTMLHKLVSNNTDINSLNGLDVITWLVENYTEHIDTLTLSNIHNRGNRVGKELQAIFEMILIASNIPMDSKDPIGKKVFLDIGLGNSVDIVSPGAIEYMLNKRNTVLISIKTTIRECWQEIREELGGIGAKEMFLLTLDQSLTSEIIQNLYNVNIQIVTTKRNKHNNYSNFSNVLDIEELMNILEFNALEWSRFFYEKKDRDYIRALLEKQLSKHENHPFIKQYYQTQIDNLN